MSERVLPLVFQMVENLLGNPAAGRKCSEGNEVMKGSRYAAVGLVAAAALWIFSGHLGPHGKGESVAANRPAEAPAAPLFRVSVMTAEVARMCASFISPAAPRPSTR